MRPNRNDRPMRVRTQHGFSMLEILITLFLLTMWLLASAGVQSSSLQFTKAAAFRTQAVYLATELGERMQANKAEAVKGTYAYGGGTVTTSTNCMAALCSSAALASFDLAEWSARVTSTLPNATVSVTGAAANPITYSIVISWTDRRTDRTYSGTGSSETFSYTSTITVFNDPNS